MIAVVCETTLYRNYSVFENQQKFPQCYGCNGCIEPRDIHPTNCFLAFTLSLSLINRFSANYEGLENFKMVVS